MDLLVADTGGTENGRGVDGDTCNPDPFLHDLKPDDELDTATGVEFAGADTEEHSEVGLCTGGLAFELGDVADVLKFGFGLAQVFSSFTTETTKDVARFVLAADLCEPTGGFGEQPDNAKEEKEWDDLESDGEPPDERSVTSSVERAPTISNVSRSIAQRSALRNLLLKPVGHHNTENVQGEFNGDELSTRFVLGGLGSPNRNDCIEDTRTETVDETSADHPVGVHSRALEGGTDDSPASTKRDCLYTTKFVTEPATNEAADQGTDVIDRDLSNVSTYFMAPLRKTSYNPSLKESVVNDGRVFRRGAHVAELHGITIVVRGTVDTTHHTLIITEEEDGQASNTVDRNEKTTLLKLVHHVEARDTIHDGDDRTRLIYAKDRKGNIKILDSGRAPRGKRPGYEEESGAWMNESTRERGEVILIVTSDARPALMVEKAKPAWGNVEI